MPVHTTCPVCAIPHLVLDSMRGKQIPCKSCQKRFVVQDGRGIKVEGPPPLPPEAKVSAEGALQAPTAISTSPQGGRSVPLNASEPVAPVRTAKARWRSENGDHGSTVLVIGVIGAVAVLLLAAGGVGVWLFLKASPQPARDVVAQAPLPPPPVVVEKPKPVIQAPVVPPPAPARVPATPWEAGPDPLPKALQMAAVPAGKVPLPVGAQVHFPRTPSPFVAIGKNGSTKDVRLLVNLQTMKPAGAIPGKVPLTALAVSPDGQYLAGINRIQGTNIEVYSFKTGMAARQFNAASKVDWVDFATSQRLVTIRSNPGRIVEVWNLSKSNPLTARADPIPFKRSRLALSPGRRYLAMFDQDPAGGPGKILLYDLAQLREAGTIRVAPPEPPGAFQQCYGLAFSPDGTELAALFGDVVNFRLRTWAMDSGSVRINHQLPASVQRAWREAVASAVRPVEWWPKRKGWLLFGTVLIHYKTGSEVTHLPAPPGPQAARYLLPGDLLATVSGLASPRFFEVTPLLSR
jgi:hypothetical protein